MKFSNTGLLLLAVLLLQAESVPNNQIQPISLNKEGIVALKGKVFSDAIAKFEAALKLDTEYTLARENLTVAHGKFGRHLSTEGKYEAALKEFHQAAFLSAELDKDVARTIRRLGKDPTNFEDRV
jgi:tetratricopeptide (TPR) repeat protein